jgi:hypothetical protein
MRETFEDLLDEITEVRDADRTQLEPRLAHLERIVQGILLTLVEATHGQRRQ